MRKLLIILSLAVCLSSSGQYGYITLPMNYGLSYADLNDAVANHYLPSTGTSVPYTYFIVTKGDITTYINVLSTNSFYSPKSSDRSIEKQDLTPSVSGGSANISYWDSGSGLDGFSSGSGACSSGYNSTYHDYIGWNGTLGVGTQIYLLSNNVSSIGSVPAFRSTTDKYFPLDTGGYIAINTSGAVTDYASSCTTNVYLQGQYSAHGFRVRAYSDAGFTSPITVDTNISCIVTVIEDGTAYAESCTLLSGTNSTTLQSLTGGSIASGASIYSISPTSSSTQTYHY